MGIILSEDRLQRLSYLFFFVSCGDDHRNSRRIHSRMAGRIFQINCRPITARDIGSPDRDNAKRNRRQNGHNRRDRESGNDGGNR